MKAPEFILFYRKRNEVMAFERLTREGVGIKRGEAGCAGQRGAAWTRHHSCDRGIDSRLCSSTEVSAFAKA